MIFAMQNSSRCVLFVLSLSISVKLHVIDVDDVVKVIPRAIYWNLGLVSATYCQSLVYTN